MGCTSFQNKNAAENIVCWNCEHFNPSRDPSGPPPRGGIGPEETHYCNGECRKNPPSNNSQIYDSQHTFQREIRAFFPFIPLGNTAWCSGFQRAVVPLPPVVSGAIYCGDWEENKWLTPDQTDVWPATYRRVALEDSCWYCHHFQIEFGPGGETSCIGFCQKDPPESFTSPSEMNATFSQQKHFPKIKNAPYKWCSKFERSTKPVPYPPGENGEPCAP